MTVIRFRITGMTCSSCAKMCKLAIGKIGGVKEVAIDESTGEAVVSAAVPLGIAVIAGALATKGYGIEA